VFILGFISLLLEVASWLAVCVVGFLLFYGLTGWLAGLLYMIAWPHNFTKELFHTALDWVIMILYYRPALSIELGGCTLYY